MHRFATVVIDPPWRYGSPGWLGGAARHYDTLPAEALASLPIDEITEPDAHLWLWTTDTHEKAALDLIEHWGFTKRANFPWIKLSQKPVAPEKLAELLATRFVPLASYEGQFYTLAYGTGYYGRANPEFLILATRGRNIVDQTGRHIRKLVQAP